MKHIIFKQIVELWNYWKSGPRAIEHDLCNMQQKS
uniref:Uncharacterized protein n=1 Tax=Arundo donax TaxID=35708 RepID=A0A0A8ZXG9_ARUDO